MTGAIARTLALGAVVIIAGPAVKVGPSAPPQPADLPAAQRTLDRAEAFLAAHTGAPDTPKTLEVGLPKWATDLGGIAGTLDGVVAADPEIVVSWARMDQEPGLAGWDLEAARVALHEQGHAEDDVPQDALDEGLRDAVALDLVPAFTYAQTGLKAEGYGRAIDAGYPEFVTQVRALSARATCSRPQGHAARHWRARISVLPRPERMALFDAAPTHICPVRS